jgi:hypothetical protein
LNRAAWAATVLLAGCAAGSATGGAEAGAPDAGDPPADLAADLAVPRDPDCAGTVAARFATDVAPIFQARCGGVECHGSNFGPTRGWHALVNVPAPECNPSRAYVAPGSPSQSYLYQKLTGTQLCGGTSMPRGGPPLTDGELATVFGWICNGAPE